MSHYDRYRRRNDFSINYWAILLFFLALGLGFLISRWIGSGPSSGIDPNAKMRPVDAPGPKTSQEETTIEIYKEASPSVVHITTLIQRRGFFEMETVAQGSGSGFIWDKKGHIVTNYHVIKNAAGNGGEIQVTFANRGAEKATVVGAAPGKDLAVLYINPKGHNLQPIKIGSSNDLEVGQSVYAIGNPFGLDQTLTTGVVSGLGRKVGSREGNTLQGLIQTDAAINPGNSGGPLLDSSKRLIGVNTAIISPSGASAGIGFAIPVDEVNFVVTQIIRGKEQQKSRPSLGIQPAPTQLTRRWGINGVLILNIVPDGPADRAGLLPTQRDTRGRILLGDIILAIDDSRVRTPQDLLEVLSEYNPGDVVTLTIARGEEQIEREVKLGSEES